MGTTSAVFKNRIDQAEEVEVGKTYDTQQILQLVIPLDSGQGDYLDVNGDQADFGTEPLASVPVGWTQAAADLTPAEFLLVNLAEARAVLDIGEAGLRGDPVANATALTALIAKDYERRKTLDTGKEWVFELGKTPTGTNLADDAVTGAWVEVITVQVVQNPTPTTFVNLGNWHGVNLQNVITNGMLVGLGTGSAGTGAPSGAYTGSMKVTRIGDWIQQDFLTGNAPGTVVGERFSRQSFNSGATWTSWFGQ